MGTLRLKHIIETRFFLRGPLLRLLILGLLFASAFYLRLYGIGKPPMEFAAVRQYHSALLARGFYEWWLTGELKTVPPDGIIEPPILELVASIAYLVLGGEHLWVPRLLSALFWMVAGIFLYLTAKKMVSANAATLSVFFYLFDPATVPPSRAFMPDPLMIMLLVISVFTILRYHERPSTSRLMAAVIASSLAIFVKPGICLFPLFGAFVSLAVCRRGLRKALVSPHLLVFAALSVSPTGLYYLYGTFLAGFLQGEVQTKVASGYVLEAYFWKGWLRQISIMVGYVAFVGGLLGVALSRPGFTRALMVGLWGGYLLFGFTFAYHIHTHNYYSLQLVPVVALSLGAVWDSVAGYLGRADTHHLRWAAIFGLCILGAVAGVTEHRQNIIGVMRGGEDFQRGSVGQPLRADYEGQARTYREVGEVVNHSARTVYSAPDFGYPLVYHGRLGGDYWPTSDMVRWWRSDERAEQFMLGMLPMDEWHRGSGTTFDRKDYFDALYSEDSPRYFIVFKRYVDWHKANWKKDRLLMQITEDLPVVAKDDDYIVFDLRRKRGST